MNQQEACNLLEQQLARYRTVRYSDLVAKIDSQECFEILGPSGVEYQVEIQFFWDGRSHCNIRVIGSIDDGGLRAFYPMCESFIMTPEGECVANGR